MARGLPPTVRIRHCLRRLPVASLSVVSGDSGTGDVVSAATYRHSSYSATGRSTWASHLLGFLTGVTEEYYMP